MKKELLTNLLILFVVVIVDLSLTACGNDDEPGTQVYTYGWQDIQASGSDFGYLSEINTVESAFKAAIGAPSPVTLSGSAGDCDAKIKAACEKAETSLKDKEWGFSGRFEVKNMTSDKVIYTLRFTSGGKLD